MQGGKVWATTRFIFSYMRKYAILTATEQKASSKQKDNQEERTCIH